MKRSDITDLMVCKAAAVYSEARDIRFITDILVMETGAPLKVVYAAVERTFGRGYLDYGVSLRTAWLTDKGLALLAGQAR